MLRLIKYLFILLFLTVLLGPFVVAYLAISDKPMIEVNQGLTADDVLRAEDLIKANDPRRLPAGSLHSLNLPEDDINLLLRYGFKQVTKGAAGVDLHSGAATLYMSLRVPKNPLGKWVNVRAGLSQFGDRVMVDYLEAGSIRIPYGVANFVLSMVDQQLRRDEMYRAVMQSINGVRISETQMTVVYLWQPDLVKSITARGKELLIPAAERERMLAYAGHLADITNEMSSERRAPFHRIFASMLELAAERSKIRGEPGAENRAALATLAFYVNGMAIAPVLGVEEPDLYKARPMELMLQGRADFAQHFTISAALAAAGGSGLADAVGLFKEVDDSQGGSGFSFTDLAADRAGVRFAEVATGDRAADVQRMVIGGDETVYMPKARDFPEFMDAAEFQARYGGVDSPRYKQVAQDIERRIEALPIHR
ncbi:MAG: hypothetical protein ACPGUC_07125 [Gammaproteobacteria bacterium]